MRYHREPRRRVQIGLLSLAMLMPLAAHADSWQQTQREARGQTVWFNAWGGDQAVNHYLDWVSGEVKRDYAVDLRIVHIADAADTVKRIQTEARAGRKTHGSVDLLWVNGENFRTLKEANLLRTGWAEQLPNWRYVDTRKPVRDDFSVPTDGAESPWGSAQLTFIARLQQTPLPPTSPQALLDFAKAHPGTVTYPRPPDFTGTALLEQLLINLTGEPDALKQPPDAQTFAAVTAPLWRYLDTLHPLLWRQGKDFPPSPARMDALLTNGTLRLSLTFNPMHAKQKVAKEELPKDSYSFGFTQGMIGNVHFVTIPANASASAGAQVVANFLLSPEAQLRKADPAIWGDPSVLDARKLNAQQQQVLQQRIPENAPPVLAEPHSAWVNVLEQEWLRRYGTH
ncbi:TPA: ABC transporter substrate-binding protein [Kluyvera cryocrescens]|uniref:ABC transporter substrate-binding protein n=1 Tax=Kluyvera cryocrescens TaxID=580 RepID=UPI00330D87F2|nr:ABC transporter substrate-binding protein [Kluyvera cryocrescens]